MQPLTSLRITFSNGTHWNKVNIAAPLSLICLIKIVKLIKSLPSQWQDDVNLTFSDSVAVFGLVTEQWSDSAATPAGHGGVQDTGCMSQEQPSGRRTHAFTHSAAIIKRSARDCGHYRVHHEYIFFLAALASAVGSTLTNHLRFCSLMVPYMTARLARVTPNIPLGFQLLMFRITPKPGCLLYRGLFYNSPKRRWTCETKVQSSVTVNDVIS